MALHGHHPCGGAADGGGVTEIPARVTDREKMLTRLQSRVAIVTGAAQGIGAAYAKALAARGSMACAVHGLS